jgi:hypothetical protein
MGVKLLVAAEEREEKQRNDEEIGGGPDESRDERRVCTLSNITSRQSSSSSHNLADAVAVAGWLAETWRAIPIQSTNHSCLGFFIVSFLNHFRPEPPSSSLSHVRPAQRGPVHNHPADISEFVLAIQLFPALTPAASASRYSLSPLSMSLLAAVIVNTLHGRPPHSLL